MGIDPPRWAPKPARLLQPVSGELVPVLTGVSPGLPVKRLWTVREPSSDVLREVAWSVCGRREPKGLVRVRVCLDEVAQRVFVEVRGLVPLPEALHGFVRRNEDLHDP